MYIYIYIYMYVNVYMCMYIYMSVEPDVEQSESSCARASDILIGLTLFPGAQLVGDRARPLERRFVSCVCCVFVCVGVLVVCVTCFLLYRSSVGRVFMGVCWSVFLFLLCV